MRFSVRVLVKVTAHLLDSSGASPNWSLSRSRIAIELAYASSRITTAVVIRILKGVETTAVVST